MSEHDRSWPVNLKALLRSGGVYLFFSLLSRAIPFLMLPVLTRYIDPVGYGVVAVVMMVTGIAMPLIGVCSNSVLFQRYFKLDTDARVDFLADCYKIIAVNTVLACVLAVPFASVIESRLQVSIGWFELALLGGGAGMVTTLTTSLFQIKKQALQFGVFQAVTAFINVSLTILLVIAIGWAWQGRIWAMTISAFIVAISAIVVSHRSGDIAWRGLGSAGHVGSLYRLGGALIPSTISGWALTMSDRLFLTSMTSLEKVGIYAVGVMIAQVTDVFLNALGQAYLPNLYEQGHRRYETERIRLVQSIYAMVGVSLVVALTVACTGPYVLEWFIDPRYHSAAEVIVWVCFSYAFFSIAAIFHGLILIAEKNIVTIYVSALTLAVNLVGNYLLIGRFGMVGAAMGNTLSAFVFMVFMVVFSIKVYELPWLDRRVYKFFVANN